MMGGREGIVPTAEGLEHKVFGQALLLLYQLYCFPLLFYPQMAGAQSNELLPPALRVGLSLGSLGLLESV
jgi:hypothetical protein